MNNSAGDDDGEPLRAVVATRPPAATNRATIASPKPFVPPVTNIRLPANSVLGSARYAAIEPFIDDDTDDTDGTDGTDGADDDDDDAFTSTDDDAVVDIYYYHHGHGHRYYSSLLIIIVMAHGYWVER